MPAVRPSARPTTTSFHDIGHSSLYNFETQLEAYTSPRTPTQDISEPFTTPQASKKRRSPNAFILFRSHVIAKKLYPSEMKHQNDISCYVADMWRSASASERAVFFRKAEEEKIRCEIEGPFETQKKKRTRKARPPKVYERVSQLNVSFNLPEVPTSPSMYASSPTSIEDNGSPMPVQYTTAFNFYTPPKNAPASPPIVPQPHPPSLLGWDLQTNCLGPYAEERVFRTPEWLALSHESSFSPASSGVPHNYVAAFDNALQFYLASLDMAVSVPVDAYSDVTSTLSNLSSFNPLPYPFDAYNMPVAPF